MRNKIRLNLLPLMEMMNPSIMETIQETGMRLSEVASIYHRDREEAKKQKVLHLSEGFMRISIADVQDDIAPISFLHELLFPLGFNHSQIKDIYRCLSVPQSGKRFYAKEWEVIRDRDALLIQRMASDDVLPELLVEEMERTTSFVIPKDKHIACLDADKVSLPLIVRKWKQGDKFVPLGMTGKKKVSDYLTDKKFSLFQKENQYVVCCGEDIVWLVNERPDNRFCVTNQTERILLIQIKKDGQ